MNEVVMRDVQWLWRHRVPRGQVTVIDGDPADGKSVLTIECAATVSTGRRWPDGATCQRGNTLIVSPEDEVETTVAPRVLAAGGDPSRVFAYQREFTLTEDDLDELDEYIERLEIDQAIFDPLSTVIPAGVSGWNDVEMRRLLRPLQELARRRNVAVIIVRHLNKKSGGKAIHRGMGSVGIVAAVRMALLVARDPDDPDRRILAVEKSNIGPEVESLAYRLKAVRVAGLQEPVVKVVWEGVSAHSADTLVTNAGTDTGKGKQAETILAELLADGPLPSEEVISRARERGVGRESVWKAKKTLGIIARKQGMAGGWHWQLPMDAPSSCISHGSDGSNASGEAFEEFEASVGSNRPNASVKVGVA